MQTALTFFVWLGCARVTFSTFDQHRVSELKMRDRFLRVALVFAISVVMAA